MQTGCDLGIGANLAGQGSDILLTRRKGSPVIPENVGPVPVRECRRDKVRVYVLHGALFLQGEVLKHGLEVLVQFVTPGSNVLTVTKKVE
ncbi:MAG: hypothetical protein AUK02_06295 [Anaerolineae bacterium CG2_30_58_95]|nr:MAG: hypothetical protein AUK02_06295 [Anaerolineae bacterium CG2_30_58_95]